MRGNRPAVGGGSGPLLGSVSFEQSFRNNAPQLYRYIARRLGPDLAEELTAQTFAEAWAGRAGFDAERGEMRAWLFGIATNLIRRHHRNEERQLRAFARRGPDPTDVAGPDETLDRIAAQAAAPELAAALLELRSVDRDLFWLQATTDLTYTELAEVTGTAVGTVRSRLSRARARLAAAVDDPDEPSMP